MAGIWYRAVIARLRRDASGSAGPALAVFDLDQDHGAPPQALAGLLGGKGAGLAEMRRVLRLPVPPGFVIGAPLCRQ